MTEYIKREALIERIDDIWDCADLVFEPDDHCCRASDCASCKWAKTKNAIRKIIANFPAADVPDRKVGKWVKARGSWCSPGGDPVWECSECGKGVHVFGIEHGTYGSDVASHQWVACPNCGAEMEES